MATGLSLAQRRLLAIPRLERSLTGGHPVSPQDELRSIIAELDRSELLAAKGIRTFPQQPHCNAFRLPEFCSAEQGMRQPVRSGSTRVRWTGRTSSRAAVLA